MKVSKRQLKRIIKEEKQKLITEAYTLYDDDGGEWEEYKSLDDVKAALEDLSSRMDTDDWEVEDPEGNRVPVYKLEEGKSTRTTKRQLRRIIKEATAEEMERWESDYRDEDLGYSPRNNPGGNPAGLYVNLTDEQENALNDLDAAMAVCVRAGCSSADVMDTVQGYNLK